MSDVAWSKVVAAVASADSITWDECHKIYVLMDAQQTEQMRGYGYDPLLRVNDIGQARALELLHEWYDSSCPLRFINGVRTVEGDPNEGFVNLIAQFEDES